MTLGPMPDPVEAHSGGVYAPVRGVASRVVQPLRRLVEWDRRRLLGSMVGQLRGVRVVELGSGDGALLQLMRAEGAKRVLGIEPATPAGAGEALAAGGEGAEVLGVRVEEVDLDQGDWDLVVCWHSLEHLPDPEAALERISGWLTSGGRLIVAVPDRSGLQSRIGGDRWFHQDIPRHRSHWSRRGIGLALQRHGFVVEHTRHVALDGGPLGMWQTILNRLTRQPNFAFRLLKRDAELKLRPFDLAVTVLMGLPLIPLAAAAEALAGLAGCGGTLVIGARKP